MEGVEIIEVENLAPRAPELVGAWVDGPTPGSRSGTFSVAIHGHVLTREPLDVKIDLIHEGLLFRRLALGVARHDVAAAYPDVPGAEKSGFGSNLSVLGLAPEFELRVDALVVGRSRVPFAVIRGRRERLTTDYRPRMRPLLLTTLPRTGSTWVTHLLGQHPMIATYRPYEAEPRFLMYWMQVLRSLAEPVSYLRPLDPVNMKDPHWWLGGGSDRLPVVPDGEIQTLLGREHVRRVAAFCQEGMDRFYEGVALLSGKPHATYFAEKFQTDPVTSALVQELYPEGREVFLVRDFRDVLCSIIAFSSSRNIGHAFGRDRTANDEEYVSVLKQSAARLLDDWRRRGESSHLLRYEDLVLRPEKTLQQLLEYLEVEADDETASVTLDAAKSERSQQLQRRHQTSESAEASIGRWRTDLSPSLQSAADEAFREMLDELGYPPNDAAPSTAGAQGAG